MKIIENLSSDINKLVGVQSNNLNQVNLLNILFMANDIFTGESESVRVNGKGDFEVFKEKLDKEKQESNEQPDTTDIPELDSEEYSAERRNQPAQELKIPDQMLSRLPITLAQLKPGNNTQNLLNGIRQLFYSFYRSKKLS